MHTSNNANFLALCHNKIRKTNKRIIVFLLFYSICGCIHYGAELVAEVPSLIDLFFYLSLVYSIIIPVAISQCCSSLIFLQYELSISQLTNNLRRNYGDSINIDYCSMTTDYKKIICSFNKELKFWSWFFNIKFLGFFCFFCMVIFIGIDSLYTINE